MRHTLCILAVIFDILQLTITFAPLFDRVSHANCNAVNVIEIKISQSTFCWRKCSRLHYMILTLVPWIVPTSEGMHLYAWHLMELCYSACIMD